MIFENAIVLKFGGSSLATPERVRNACDIVRNTVEPVAAVVCSSFGGVTDQLIEMCHLAIDRDERYRQELEAFTLRHRKAVQALIEEPQCSALMGRLEEKTTDLQDILHGIYLLGEATKKTRDFVMSFGERFSNMIVTEVLRVHRPEVSYLNATKVIKTDDRFGRARVIQGMTDQAIRDYFSNEPGLKVVTGFIGSTAEQQVTTLGRGGSDYTASIIGAALGCQEIRIWTDVNGFMSADPRRLPEAFSVPTMTYEEAMEMAHFGAKVIYPPSLAPAMRHQIPVTVRNSFSPDHLGTTIRAEISGEPFHVSGLTSIDRVALIRLKAKAMMPLEAMAAGLFSALVKEHIHVLLISQASSELTVCVEAIPEDLAKAKRAIDQAFSYEIEMGSLEPVVIEEGFSIIAIVGKGMHGRADMAGQIFGALGDHHINAIAITQGSSEHSIAFVIHEEDEQRSLELLHQIMFRQRTAEKRQS